MKAQQKIISTKDTLETKTIKKNTNIAEQRPKRRNKKKMFLHPLLIHSKLLSIKKSCFIKGSQSAVKETPTKTMQILCF